MHMFDVIEENAAAIATIGERVRAEMRATGTTMSYCLPHYGTDIVREYPDGRRERRLADGTVVPIAPLGR